LQDGPAEISRLEPVVRSDAMKKIAMLLVPVFCFGLFAVTGCNPEAPKTKPADNKAPVAAPAAPAKEEPKK